MKRFFLIVLFGFCLIGFAQPVPFRGLGYPFKIQTNVPVNWQAPTKHLPKTFWIYRAVPAKVSPATISNLVALGSFTDKERKEFPDYPHLIAYDGPAGKMSLRINTDWAYIDYSDPDADDWHITNGVPNRQQAFKLAKRWLPKLGIDERQLFTNPNGGTKFYGASDTVFFYPREGGPVFATNTHSYEVVFYRAFDGIEFSGGCARGGGLIDFAHDAKISHILVSWRNYKREKRYPAATPETLLKWIREGKAVWWPAGGAPTYPDWDSAKKIAITKITPLYYSEAYDENDTPQYAAYPFAEMEAVADIGTTNLIFNLDCPIIGDDKP
jgi:hypothetical protein